jgi:dethiobiotin synthetase
MSNQQRPVFITGIGTGIGKTIVSAIVTKALDGLYWKPVQAGVESEDKATVAALLDSTANILPCVYTLQLPASPHIAAAQEDITIDLNKITAAYQQLATATAKPIIAEGAGGLFVPLNNHEFVIDLVEQLNARVILVSRNYLGSINHSLLTAAACKQRGLDVAGWIFNDQYMDYEQQIANWSGYPVIGTIPYTETPDQHFITTQAAQIKPILQQLL